MSRKKITVQEPAPRLDVWLSENNTNVSRRRARELCEAGLVFVNGHPCRAGAFLRAGSVVEVRTSLEPASAREIPPEPGSEKPVELDVAYDDPVFLVVRKPRGISTVTLRDGDPFTLADILVTYGPSQKEVSPDIREAGLMQRLDYWTSGILLAAKNRAIWERLRKDLLGGRIHKSYVALVEGWPEQKNYTIESPLIQSPGGKQMQIAPRAHKDALLAHSEVDLLRKFKKEENRFALVRVRANRARRHQVRVHLAATGNPLCGDTYYGAKHDLWALGEDFLQHVSGPNEGFLLHAETLSFRHPVSSKEVFFRDFPEWADHAESFFV